MLLTTFRGQLTSNQQQLTTGRLVVRGQLYTDLVHSLTTGSRLFSPQLDQCRSIDFFSCTCTFLFSCSTSLPSSQLHSPVPSPVLNSLSGSPSHFPLQFSTSLSSSQLPSTVLNFPLQFSTPSPVLPLQFSTSLSSFQLPSPVLNFPLQFSTSLSSNQLPSPDLNFTPHAAPVQPFTLINEYSRPSMMQTQQD